MPLSEHVYTASLCSRSRQRFALVVLGMLGEAKLAGGTTGDGLQVLS